MCDITEDKGRLNGSMEGRLFKDEGVLKTKRKGGGGTRVSEFMT